MAHQDQEKDQQPKQSNKEPEINQNNNEVVMSITKVSSKIYKPKSYNKAISTPIHGRWWKKAIKEELQNFKNHQTKEYDELPPGQKAIGSK